MNLQNNILGDFENITGYDLENYIITTSNFFKDDYPTIEAYFTGVIDTVNSAIISNHQNLIKEMLVIKSLIKSNETNFKNTQYWFLFDDLDIIDMKLNTINNISKYLRSTKTNYNYNANSSYEKNLGFDQSVDSFTLSELKINDESVANELALLNNLLESDYNLKEGKNIIVFKANENELSEVSTIIDNPTKLSIFGKDLPLRKQFINNDQLVLGYKDTFIQNSNTLAKLKQGEIPEFPFMGIDLVIGNNIGALSYNTIIRQLSDTFASDDLYSSLSVDKILFNQGDIKVEFSVQVKYNGSLILTN